MITLSEVNLKDENEINQVAVFLEGLGIKFERDVDYSLVYKKIVNISISFKVK